jgi:hypothetical protein
VQLHHPDCYPSAQKCSWWAVPRPSVTLGNFQTLDHRKVAKQFRLKNLEQNPILHDASWCFMMLHDAWCKKKSCRSWQSWQRDWGCGGCRPSSFAANGPPVSNATSSGQMHIRESHAPTHTLYHRGQEIKTVKHMWHEKTAPNNQLHSLSTAKSAVNAVTTVVI